MAPPRQAHPDWIDEIELQAAVFCKPWRFPASEKVYEGRLLWLLLRRRLHARGQETASLSPLLTDVSQREGETPVANQNDYASLKRRIQDAGLLDKRPGYYALSISTTLILFVAINFDLFTIGTLRGEVLAGVALGIVSGQLGFQLHDSGHRQMFASP